MLQKFHSDKINVTKNALFFLSRAATDHSFAFNSQFLYELKHKVHMCVAFSIFDFISFLLKFIFLFNKKHGLFNVIIPSRKKNNRKATHRFAPRPLSFKL